MLAHMTTTRERPTDAGEPTDADTAGHGLTVQTTYSQRRLGRTADYQRELRERREARETHARRTR
jgi:hypothetical protein